MTRSINNVPPVACRLTTAALVLTLTAGAAHAQEVYEGFDIGFQVPVGPPVDIGNGLEPGSSGFGWAGDWAVSLSLDALKGPEGLGAAGSWGPDQDGTAPDNLDFNGYTSGGFTTGRTARRLDAAGSAVMTRSLSGGVLADGTQDGGEVWFSMLYEAPGFNIGFGMTMGETGFDADTTRTTGTDTERGYGFQIRPGSGAMEIIARGWKGDGYIGAGSPIPVAQNEECLIVCRYQFVAGQDTLTVWKVNETDTGRNLQELSSSSFVTNMEPAEFLLMSMFDSGNPRLDEIAVATVAPGESPELGLDAVAPGMNLSILGPAVDVGLYEGFDIPFNQAVGPVDGSSGTGWSDDWSLALSLDALEGPTGRGAGESFGPDQDLVLPDNLDFDGYTSGGHTTGRSVKRLNGAGTSALTRPFYPESLQSGMLDGGEIWASVLMAIPTNNSDFGLGLGNQSFDPATKRPFGLDTDRVLGFQVRTQSGSMNLIARGWKGAGFVGAGDVSIPVAQGEEMLVVMRYEIGAGTDTLTVWKVVETDTGAYLSDLPSSVFATAIDPLLLTQLSQYHSSNFTWDEVRFAPVGPGGDSEAGLDAVAPGMNLDIAPPPDLTYVADTADLYEPFQMTAGETLDQQGSGKGWGEAGPGDVTGASRWDMTAASGAHTVLDPSISLGTVPLFGTPELIFNGSSIRRVDTAGGGSITREIDPALAAEMFAEGGETWISLALDLNEREGIVTPTSGNNTALVFANAPCGPEGYANLPEGSTTTFGEYSGFGFRITGTAEGVDTIIRPTAFFDGWKESADDFPPVDSDSTNWFSGDKIFVVMRIQWRRQTDGVPTDLDANMIPDDGTTDVVTLWRLVPEFAIGGTTTNLDTFENMQLIQGSAYFGADPGSTYPVGEVMVRNEHLTHVSIAQNLGAAVDELRVSYPRPGESSQDALSRVAPGLALTVSNTYTPPAPDCVADVNTTNTNPGDPGYGVPDGTVDGADLSYYVENWLNQVAAVADVNTTNTNPGDSGYGMPDGTVDGADLSYYVENWLAGCP